MKYPLLVLGLGAVLAFSVACDDNPTEPSDVIAHNWQLVALQQEGSDPITVPDPSRYTLRLEDDGRASVRSDCNTCGGDYDLIGSTLELSPMVCTQIACGGDTLDPMFARALEGEKTVSINGGELTVRSADITLRFREE